MKIQQVGSSPIPSKSANSIQMMKMAQAYFKLGHDIELLLPQSKSPSSPSDLLSHYGLEMLPPIREIQLNPRLRGYDLAFKASRIARANEVSLIHTRQPQAAAWAADNGLPTAFEIHDLPSGFMGPRLFRIFLSARGARLLIVISEALKKALEEKYSRVIGKVKIAVLPDGIDLQRYKDLPTAPAARKKLQLPDKFTIGYTGHLYQGRGLDLILDLAKQMPKEQFLVAGGKPADISKFEAEQNERSIANIHTIGFVPNAVVPLYQAASDVLLMPYQSKVSASSGGDISSFLSPMKMFEYMAAARPILSSDLPVLQEVLDNESAMFLPIDESAAWIEALNLLKQSPEIGQKLARAAREKVEGYSWQRRAETIVNEFRSN